MFIYKLKKITSEKKLKEGVVKNSYQRIIVLFLSTISLGALADVFIIDKEHTNVGFAIKHLMISKVRGRFNQFDGDVDFQIKNKIFTKMNASILVNSIDTNEKERDKHLLSQDFFKTSTSNNKAPENIILFNMKSYKKINTETGIATGYLTIKGIKKEIDLEVTIGGLAKDPWGNFRLAFEAKGKINRSDFGLKWNKAIETGGLFVDNIVELIIEAQGIAK